MSNNNPKEVGIEILPQIDNTHYLVKAAEPDNFDGDYTLRDVFTPVVIVSQDDVDKAWEAANKKYSTKNTPYKSVSTKRGYDYTMFYDNNGKLCVNVYWPESWNPGGIITRSKTIALEEWRTSTDPAIKIKAAYVQDYLDHVTDIKSIEDQLEIAGMGGETSILISCGASDFSVIAATAGSAMITSIAVSAAGIMVLEMIDWNKADECNTLWSYF